jgi:imidazolonepropionase-like amidohydrolase
VVEDGRIRAVGRNVAVPEGLPVIDGQGMTVLPGMIDAHAHAQVRENLERALQFGVTTELDMWNRRGFVAAMKREQERTGAPYRADLYSAINPATVREGYPYNFTPDVVERPTLYSAAEADRFVRERFDEGSDYIKIMMEDGSEAGFSVPFLSRPMLRGLTEAAHRRGRLAVAHVTEKAHARNLLEDGIDGLVHVFVDEVIDPAMLQLAVQRKVFVVATLAVEEAFVTTAGGAELIADPDLGPWLTEEEKASLLTPAPPTPLTLENVEIAKRNVRFLHGAGVPILTGSDTPTHGVTIHRDLELLVEAGLSPRDALVGATSAAAKAFGLDDRGRLAPGLRADLWMVEGDPTTQIKATRAIRRVWKGGVEVERQLPAAAPAH